MTLLAEPKRAKDHPLAGKTMSGADALLQVLADEGVDAIFGYSGGAILPTYDAIFRYNEGHAKDEEIRLIVPATEQGAGFMAAGYARSSGKVGVFLVTSGPGATNSVTPIRDCQADSVPVVLICGQVPRGAIGTDAFQEAPVFNIMAACAKHVFLVTDETKLEATMRTAFEIARSGRPGPVVIDLPKDVQNAQVTFEGSGFLPLRGYADRQASLHRAVISEDEGQAFFRMLEPVRASADLRRRRNHQRQRRPGAAGVRRALPHSGRDDADGHRRGRHDQRPVAAHARHARYGVRELRGRGLRLPVRDRLALRRPRRRQGQGVRAARQDRPPRRRRLGDRQGQERRLGARRRCQARTHPADEGGEGLQAATSAAGWRTYAKLRTEHALNYNRQSDLIQSEEVLEILNEITRGEAIVTTGVGQHQMWAAQYLDFVQPRTFLTSGSMGTMGFGLPAAVGAQIANPGKLVIDVDGDGSIRMNLGELETLTTYDIPVKVLLLNNFGDGMVRQWQDLFFENRYSGTDKTLHKKDFVKAVEADGFEFAQRVSEKAQIRPVLEAFIEVPGTGVPRSHGRPERPRLPDGRPGHGLQGHDHRQAHQGARRRHRADRRLRELLTVPRAAAGLHPSPRRQAPLPLLPEHRLWLGRRPSRRSPDASPANCWSPCRRGGNSGCAASCGTSSPTRCPTRANRA